jgi:hypothetical protein
MTDLYRDNPFEVLRLDPAAGEEEIVAHAGRLRQRAADEAEVAAIRRAVQALTGRAEERWVHQLFTHPRPCYRWRALERFAAAFRRSLPPSAAGDTCGSIPARAKLDFRELAALLDSSAAGDAELPAETRRRIADALWQWLLHDLGA